MDQNKTGDFFNRPPKFNIKKLLWNPDTKQFLRRTKESWAKILFFYFVFYICLAGMSMALWYVFMLTMPEGRPMYTDIIGDNPGMSFRPLPQLKQWHFENKRALIRCHKGDKEKNRILIDDVKQFLTESHSMYAFDKCSPEDDFGYDACEPCVFLKLNKIFDWKPEVYKSDSALPAAMPMSLISSIKHHSDDEAVWVSCENEESGAVNVIYNGLEDKQGFPVKYFPYDGSIDYHQPLVAVKFSSLPVNTLVKIECKAWAKNIKIDRADQRGLVRFTLNVIE